MSHRLVIPAEVIDGKLVICLEHIDVAFAEILMKSKSRNERCATLASDLEDVIKKKADVEALYAEMLKAYANDMKAIREERDQLQAQLVLTLATIEGMAAQ